MLRMLAQLVLSLLANTAGLLAAALLLDRFSINASSFILAVFVFSLSTVILGPFILKMTLTNASFLTGGVALVTTLVGLIITNVFTDGLSISGLSTWVLASLIVWIFSVAANLVLPLIFFKKLLNKNKASNTQDAGPTKPNFS